LVLGICALVPVLGIVLGLAAIVVGIIALAGRRPGKGMAIAGLVLGSVGLMTAPLLPAILLPALARAREQARRTICTVNLSSIGKAVLIYQAEHEAMPPDTDTLIRAGTSPKAFDCPSAKANRSCDYFYFAPTDPKALSESDETIIACDYNGNPPGGRNVLYLDGHVAWLSESAFQRELAKPCNAAFAAALKKAEGP